MFTIAKKTNLHRQQKHSKMKKFKLMKSANAGRCMSNNKQTLLHSQLDVYLPARQDKYIHRR